jgi:hypothetical protein
MIRFYIVKIPKSISTIVITFRDLADASHSSFDRARRGAGLDAAGIFDQVGGTPSKIEIKILI